jgi:hypothetical protein
MKKKIVMLIFACVCVVLLVVWCSEDTIVEPPLGAVSGHVFEAGTTTIIDSARIYFSNSGHDTFTDETGYYSIIAFPGSYTLMAERDGYQGSSAEIRVLPADTITQDFELGH